MPRSPNPSGATRATRGDHPYRRGNPPNPGQPIRQPDMMSEAGGFKALKMAPPPSPLSPNEMRVQINNLQRFNTNIQFLDRAELQKAMNPATWHPHELKAQRRIIEFTVFREFQANLSPIVRIQWKAIEQQYWQGNKGNTFAISVIAYDDKWLITSVDVISSVECFFGTHLCTGEKNRIRRGFEFRTPETLHKGEGSVYALVQSFVNPKPRNIDKSVKVFDACHYLTLVEKICGCYIVTVDNRFKVGPLTHYTNPNHWQTDLEAMDEQRRLAHQFTPVQRDETYVRSEEPTTGLNMNMGVGYCNSAIVPDNPERSTAPATYPGHGYSNGMSSLGHLAPMTHSSRPYDLTRSLEASSSYSQSPGHSSNSNPSFPSPHNAFPLEASPSNGFHLPMTARYSNGSSSSYATASNGRPFTNASADSDEVTTSYGQRHARHASLLDLARVEPPDHMFETTLSSTPSNSNENALDPMPRPLNGYSHSENQNGYRSLPHPSPLSTGQETYFKQLFNSTHPHSESAEYPPSSSSNAIPTYPTYMSHSSFPYARRS